jgi:hypothetical protein
MEMLVEAMFGKKFPIRMIKNGNEQTLVGVASANAKPGERPYRITWFTPDLTNNRHVDLDFHEMQNILNEPRFPEEVVNRIKNKWPDHALIGDEYHLTAK